MNRRGFFAALVGLVAAPLLPKPIPKPAARCWSMEEVRLVVAWRGRTVLYGLPRDPQNWFMSRPNDPRNFTYKA